jgi:TPP-dependent pyruvate/acetoin dehydrogenase alpha subunit
MNLFELQKLMLRIRMIEESIAEKYSEQKMRCPTHLSIGQEAISVGVCSNLSNKDLVLSTHRAHAHYLAKGGNLKSMLAEIYGKKTGCSKGMGGSMHLIDKSVGFMGSTAIVGNTIPVAVGMAYSMKLKNNDCISCVFFGDGATEEGVFFESINFAIIHSLPIIFICENNFYSVYSGLEVRQPKGRKIFKMTSSLGIESTHGDGNDVLDVHKKTKSARQKISEGKGPQFLEFETYRWREHCGPNYDNHIGYREEEEFLEWQKKDPLKDFYNSTTKENLIKIKDELYREINSAHTFAEKSDFQDIKDFNKSL